MHPKKFTRISLLSFLIISLCLTACKTPAVPAQSATAPAVVSPPAGTLPAPEISVASSAATQTEPQQQNTPTQEPLQNPASLLAAAPGPRTHYQLDVSMDYYSRYANVVEKISYTNTTGTELTQIPLHIPMRHYPGSYHQGILSTQPASSFREQEEVTWLDLEAPLQPAAELVIDIVYRLVMPNQAATFGATDQQTNLVNWYPYIPAYREGQGFVIHQPVYDNEKKVYVGEYIVNEISDFDVSLRLTNRPELIEVAASAEAEGEPKSGNYRYRLQAARGFAFSISDSYFIHEIKEGDLTIRSYTFINHENAGTGQAILPIASQAMRLFSDRFFPYPRDLVSIVVADYLHNMEMDGMVMISYGVFDFFDNTAKNNLTILTPHELSHQWFYSVIGNDQALEPWLDEAIATYCELLYYEAYHPELVSWWWDQRVDVHNPSGYINPGIEQAGGYDAYRNGVYLEGARFMRALRESMGDEAFFTAFKDYANTMAWKISSSQDFKSCFDKHSPVDLSPVYARYFSP